MRSLARVRFCRFFRSATRTFFFFTILDFPNEGRAANQVDLQTVSRNPIAYFGVSSLPLDTPYTRASFAPATRRCLPLQRECKGRRPLERLAPEFVLAASFNTWDARLGLDV